MTTSCPRHYYRHVDGHVGSAVKTVMLGVLCWTMTTSFPRYYYRHVDGHVGSAVLDHDNFFPEVLLQTCRRSCWECCVGP